MNKEYYFISGLPRSGSTLLSAILKQNPDFYADISSPVQGLVVNAIDFLSNSENNLNIDENRRKDVIQHVFEGYYKFTDRQVIFDSNRHWTARTSLLKTLFPYTKIICCVRDIPSILDSFERLASKNCFFTNTFIGQEESSCVETRCMSLMDVAKAGSVIKPYILLEDALAANPEIIHLVEYKNLCKNPKETIQKIYNFIGKPYYEHDFDNVEYQNELFDATVGMKDLHTVKRKVEWIDKKLILPDYVIKKFTKKEFWKEDSLLKYE